MLIGQVCQLLPGGLGVGKMSMKGMKFGDSALSMLSSILVITLVIITIMFVGNRKKSFTFWDWEWNGDFILFFAILYVLMMVFTLILVFVGKYMADQCISVTLMSTIFTFLIMALYGFALKGKYCTGGGKMGTNYGYMIVIVYYYLYSFINFYDLAGELTQKLKNPYALVPFVLVFGILKTYLICAGFQAVLVGQDC